MVKQHAQVITTMMGLCDLTVVGVAGVAAWAIRNRVASEVGLIPPLRDLLAQLFVALLVSLVVLTAAGLYKPRRDKSFLLELGQILKASVVIWVLLIVIADFTAPGSFIRAVLALFLPLLAAGLILERGTYRAALRFLRRRGWNLRHALIVGTGRLAQSTLLHLQRNSWTGIRVTGFIDAPDGRQTGRCAGPTHVRGIRVLGDVSDLRLIVERSRADCIFVALPLRQAELLGRVIADLEKTAADVRVIPDLFLSRFPMHAGISDLDGLPIISLRENPLAGWPALYKRLFDMVGAIFGLILFGLPMLVIAVAIKMQDGGPIFYTQRRMSYGDRPFNILKFRTMVVSAEADGPAFAARDDARCTPLGRWLRSLSLDELPQLLNVLKGDMSLVGPRPERPEMLAELHDLVPGFPLRLKARAGLTGWAQIHGYRGGGRKGEPARAPFRKRLQYDLYYLNHWSPLLDVRILLATLFRGFHHPNAY